MSALNANSAAPPMARAILHALMEPAGGAWIPLDDGREALLDRDLLLSLVDDDSLAATERTLRFVAISLLRSAIAHPVRAGFGLDALSSHLYEMPEPLPGTLGPQGVPGRLVDLPRDTGKAGRGCLRVPFREIREGLPKSPFDGLGKGGDIGGIEPLGPISGHGNGSGAENREPAPSAFPAQPEARP